MKRLFIYILPLMLCVACNELEKYPQDAVSAKYYFQNEEQLQQYTNQFYTIMPGASSCYQETSDLLALTTLADEATGNRVIPPYASSSSWTWGTLRHINYFLEHVNQCSDKAARDKYTGLALFFRAYFYFDKVRRFGDVPWLDKPLGSSDSALYKPRDNRDTVIQYVIKDLDSAIALMPAEKPTAYQVNRYTAMALKSRVCLFEGTFCKYHNVKGVDWRDYLQQAAAISQRLIDEGGYSLYDAGTQPYLDMFRMNDLRACPEMIMARGYDGSMGLKHNASSYTTSLSTGRPGFTKRLVNQYLCTDGSRYTDREGYDTIAMGEEMTGRDPRLEQTMFRPGHYIRLGKTEQEFYNPTISITGYQLIKYVTEEIHDNYNNSENDMPIFRLAEIYLNYAEAKAELGESGKDIENAINVLRNRVGMPVLLDAAAANANPCPYMESLYPNVDQGGNKGLILEIRRERAIELVLEGHRYWDLIRWKEGKAFENPYYGFSVPAVTKNEDDESGYMDMDGDGENDMCIWINDYPFDFGITFYEANVDLQLNKVVDNKFKSGFILADGTPDNITAGRKWREDRDYLYPLPTQEIALSKGALTQNPGWGVKQ